MSRDEDENINQAIKNSLLELNGEGKKMADEADDIARDLEESLKISTPQSSSTSITRDNKQTQQSCEACGTLDSVHVNFWGQKLCLQHYSDISDICFTCGRYMLMGMRYVNLNNGQKMCPDCFSIAILDSQKANVVFNKVHEFYKELKIKVDKNVPCFLVDQFDMDAFDVRKGGTQETARMIGCTLFSSKVINSVTSSSLRGETIEVIKKTEKLPEGKVTGMLVVYGFSVLQTGRILAHEMMHAWLMRKGYKKFDRKLEEGICEVMGFKWIDWYDFKADKYFSYTSEQSQFLENLKRWIKCCMEKNSDEIYGDGFRDAKRAVERFGLEYTLKFIDDEMSLSDTKPAEEKTENKMLHIAPFQNLISLVNKLQRVCTALGEKSALATLADGLPSIAVVGGQSCGKSSVLESVVGNYFLPCGSGIVTRRPLVLQLHNIDGGGDYAEFKHQPGKKYTDFAAVGKEIADETDREIGRSKKSISTVPIYLSIFSPNVVNLTLIDLPGLTKIAVDGQTVMDIENMVRSYIENPNCIILAISPANQDLATSDAIKISREVDPKGERTFGVLTKIDLMDKGTDAVDILEGRSYKLMQFPWIGIVNRSQADINENTDMIAARRREKEFFANTPEYRHMSSRMGSEYLGKVLSKHLEQVIKSRIIPGLQSLIYKTIIELETELSRLGGKLYMIIMEICRAFDGIFKEHLDGIRSGGDKIYYVFDDRLPAALKRLQLDKHLSMDNVRKLITEADGYQPHLFAPEQGYRRLIENSLVSIKGPAEAAIDAVHFILKELVHKSINETVELKQYPTLRAELSIAACDSLNRMKEESKRATLQLVEMECAYLTVDFFRKLPQDVDKGGNLTHSIIDRYNDAYLRRISSSVLSYVNKVCESLKNSIPKSIVYCQVREAKHSLLDHFFTEMGGKTAKQLEMLLEEDSAIMQRRLNLSERLELYRSAQTEIEQVAWSSK